ncbi:putative ribonuclease H-like domain-containing protein, partial [Tanacetum coccineum]
MYSFNIEDIVPSGGLACLIAKAIIDESNKWHRRLGHVNFKNLNKPVKGNLVRGLPSKIFQNNHTCVACQKGKQHKASLESLKDPSLRPSSSIPIPDSNPEGSGGNHGGQSSSDRSLSRNEDGLILQSVYDLCISLCKHVIIQAKEIKDLKAHINKKKARPVIIHHKAWMKNVSMKTRLAGKKSMQKK